MLDEAEELRASPSVVRQAQEQRNQIRDTMQLIKAKLDKAGN